MGTKYSSLSLEERTQIQLLRSESLSCRAIALQLKRAPSTITREFARNVHIEHGYIANTAQCAAKEHRCCAKVATRKLGKRFDTPVGEAVLAQLKQRWSPQQITGRLRAMTPSLDSPVSHETIYRAIYVLPRGQLRSEIIACLRREHGKRMPRARGKARASIIPHLVGIEQRPSEADSRAVPGHWEADLIKGAFNRSAVGTMIERTSRKVLLARLDGCTAQDALEGFSRRLLTVPVALRKSFAYDRGVEMALHEQLTQRTGIAVFFCHPHSPWERACNENLNGLVRQFLPKGTDLSQVSHQELTYIEQLLNDRPRAMLGFKTPNEVYQEIIEKLNSTGNQIPTDQLIGDNLSVALQG